MFYLQYNISGGYDWDMWWERKKADADPPDFLLYVSRIRRKEKENADSSVGPARSHQPASFHQ